MESFIPHGAPIAVQLMFWAGTTGAVALTGYVISLKRENGKLKETHTNGAVDRIEKSLDKLSAALTESTEKHAKALTEATTKFDNTIQRMWEHIGSTDRALEELKGEHKALTGNGAHSCHKT